MFFIKIIILKMELEEKQQIAERLAADLKKREIEPFEINHGIIDNPYILFNKPIARRSIYYIAKGQKLDSIGIGTFLKIKMVLDNQ
jgi:hypothetical protein